MKKTLKPQDLRNFDKVTREVIKAKRAESNVAFLEDVKQLLSQDSISREAFVGLFDSHQDFIFLGSGSKTRTITFKKDGTPDLRSLPTKVREIFKNLQLEAISKKKLAASVVLSKETISTEDLLALKIIGQTNFFKQKFATSAA